MSKISSSLKKLSICFGIYSYARTFSRLIRKEEQERHSKQIEFYRAILPLKQQGNYDPPRCFDIGTNIGEKSEAMLDLGCRVVSFEPNDDLAAELHLRCGKNDTWQYCSVALGSSPGLARLNVRKFIGQASLLDNWGTGDIRSSKNVPIITLDMAIEFFGIPKFIKIDVEGFELEVLRGLSYVIDLICIEFHLTEKSNLITMSCIEIMEKLGRYEVNICDGESLSFSSKKWIELEEFKKIFPNEVSNRYAMQSSYGDIYFRKK